MSPDKTSYDIKFKGKPTSYYDFYRFKVYQFKYHE